MESSNSQLDKLINSLDKSKNYLEKKAESEPSYRNLIDSLNLTAGSLKISSKPTIKFISPTITLSSKLKAKSEAISELRSLYNFEVIDSIKKVSDLIQNCGVICLIYHSNQNIIKSHQRLITLASKNNISVIILVQQKKERELYANLSQWLTSQDYTEADRILLPLGNFIDLDNPQHIELYQQFLTLQASKIKARFVEQHLTNIIIVIKNFYHGQTAENRQKIKEIKDTYLQGKVAERYQQTTKQIFNRISQQQRQKIIQIKQSIHQSRNDYLSPFIPNSWMFELQQIIQSSQVKVISESDATYLYLTVGELERTEFIHGYILGLYQNKLPESLNWQWTKINYDYGEGGLKALINQVNTELSKIKLLHISQIEPIEISFNAKASPNLNLAEIVDFQCLKLNSRIIFDFKYTQSSWFKLLISGLIGISIYGITKIYFDEGKYIGFVILIVQLINIFTGQDAKTSKLKQHQKELQRTVNNKYQLLVRSIADKAIQTLISNLDREDKQYQQQIEAIATIVEAKLEQIKENINQHKSKIEALKQEREKILSWFD